MLMSNWSMDHDTDELVDPHVNDFVLRKWRAPAVLEYRTSGVYGLGHDFRVKSGHDARAR